MACTLQLSHEGDLGSAGASLQPPLLGWKIWQSANQPGASAPAERGKGAHRANLLLKCSMCLALQTAIHLPGGDGTGVWQQNGDFNSCLVVKMRKTKADTGDLIQRGSPYLSGVRSLSSSDIFFFAGVLPP